MFRKEQSLALRIWHWSNVLTISLLFVTVILRKTFLGKNNINIIMAKTQELGVLMTEPVAREIAKAIRNEMWQWHPIIGFVAIGLLVARFFIYLQNRSSVTNTSAKPLYYKIVKKTHALFYFFLLIMGLSGSAMYWDEALHLSKNTTHNIQNVHETLLWFFVIFIIGHIAGVIKAELGEDKGLVSDMINGGKK